MNDSDFTPTDADLIAYDLGLLREDLIDGVTEWLEKHPEGEERIRRLTTGQSDRAIEALRQGDRIEEELAKHTELTSGIISRVLRPATAAPTPGTVIPKVAGFEVLAELGRGGMGVVYKARQLALQRLVALKMILAGNFADRDQLVRFVIEGEMLARLQHPNIVQVHEVGQHEGKPFLALEFVEGGTLDNFLASRPMQPREAARLLELLARAVHYAHLQGVIHRDLKPANILLQGLGSSDQGSGVRSQGSGASGFGSSQLPNPKSPVPDPKDHRLRPGPLDPP